MPKSVFVAVLDWGLGHATRCVPVVRELQNQNLRVVIGGSGVSLMFLKEEFKDITFYPMPSYQVKYSLGGSMTWAMLFQVPKLFKKIREEHEVLERILENEKIDFVISDNRYGCYSKRLKSVFIGHQLNLQMPGGMSFLSGIVNKIHLNKIQNFDEVWIPDTQQGFKFSGNLSRSSLKNARFIGTLSRFGSSIHEDAEAFDYVGLVSGPEPQRTKFEELLHARLLITYRKAIIIRGKPGSNSKFSNSLLREVDHLNSIELEGIIRKAGIIISRPGYSTIMDLAALGKKAVFVPTPGQTEQEYLARHLQNNGYCAFQNQETFNLEEAIKQIDLASSLPLVTPNAHLSEAIQTLMNK